jgi:peptidoglycan/LPS O-acetylase OafA/YrhL
VQAVDVFFVLSGFVIAHVTANRERDARSYFVSRATRIYSVAIPAIVVTAILDPIGLSADPTIYEAAYQPLAPGLLFRSVFFLGEQWNSHRFPGSDGPYWSLGFEVWYYITFGIFLFSPPRWRWLASIAVLTFIGPKVAILFPVWLMGVSVYRTNAALKLSRQTGWLLLVASSLLLGSRPIKSVYVHRIV